MEAAGDAKVRKQPAIIQGPRKGRESRGMAPIVWRAYYPSRMS